MAAYNPSMRIDYLARRPMEIEAIYGNVIAYAAARGYTMGRADLLRRQLEYRQSLYLG
jgi:ketopantoate reductase